MKRTRGLLAIGCACVVPFGLIACGDDKNDTAAAPATTETATTATSAPEDVLAPDAQVATGLTGLKNLAAEVGKETDSAASKKKAEGLEGFWAPVEGTVKRNEPDMYSTIEEDLSLLESGTAAKTKTGAQEMGETVDAYLAKHPG
jgi:hypothetical protein